MIKHLFSDMDGTVLNSNGEISEVNIGAIRESGLPFTLVSARSPQKLKKTIDSLEIDGVHVSFNGGLIFEKKGKDITILHREPINFSLAKKLVLDVRNKFPNTSISLYDEVNWNTDKKNEGILVEYKIVHVDVNVVDFNEYFKEEKDIFKVSFIEYDKEIFDKIADYVEKEFSNEKLTIQRSLSGYLEITHINAKKSKGIEYISKLENLNKNELAAFGDGQNDIPMFETVGYSVVMDNATDDVKKYADYVTKSNNEDGVAYAIKNFVKKI